MKTRYRLNKLLIKIEKVSSGIDKENKLKFTKIVHDRMMEAKTFPTPKEAIADSIEYLRNIINQCEKQEKRIKSIKRKVKILLNKVKK